MKKLRFLTFTLLLVLSLSQSAGQVINIPDPIPPPRSVRDTFELDPFYQQWIDVGGFPVVASEKVNPYALKEAAWLIWQVIGHRTDVLAALVKNRVRFSVIAYTELITEIPEYRDYGGGFLLFGFRGFGGAGGSSSEETLLHYPGSNSLYSVMIHEFGHAIHLSGLNTVDPTFDNRLKSAYDAAIAKGLWQGTYASSDRREYWTEGTHAWFYPKGGDSFNNGNTRNALKAYDPPLAALLAEVYGDTQWRYTPPTTRTHLPHLQGFNPQDSPIFEGWPELEELRRQFSNPNSEGSEHWVDLRPYNPNLIPNLNQSRTAGSLSEGIAFVNLTQARVFVYWVGYDGTEEYWTIVNPEDLRVHGGMIDDLWLIKDHSNNDLMVFQSKGKLGRAIIGRVPIITPGLSKISGDNQAGVSGASLSKPFVVEVRDENGSVLAGISITFAVTAGGGSLSVTNTTTDESGQAKSWFTLGTRLGTHTVSVSAAGIEGTVIFSAGAEAPVDIPDANLRAAIEEALDKAPGTPIAPAEIATMTRFEAAWNSDIKDLTRLEHATQLRSLELSGNQILNIRPLANLKNLQVLTLDENNVRDITPLKNLTQLTWLLIGDNPISDFTPLSNLNQLEGLSLYRNQMNDLTPLGSLTKLRFLWLWDNNISDISVLADLTSLTELHLARNNIKDISPLVKLPVLKELRLERNPLSYLSIHRHIPELQSRGVTFEFDADGTRPPDVNSDGSVNVLDLIAIASDSGNTGANMATDVNGDGVVNIVDLVLVADMFEDTPAAP